MRNQPPQHHEFVKKSTMHTDLQFDKQSDFPAFKGVIEPEPSYYSRKENLNPEYKCAQFDIPSDFPKSPEKQAQESPKFGQIDIIERRLQQHEREKV